MSENLLFLSYYHGATKADRTHYIFCLQFRKEEEERVKREEEEKIRLQKEEQAKVRMREKKTFETGIVGKGVYSRIGQ